MMRPWALALALLLLLPTSIHALVGPESGPADVWIWSPSNILDPEPLDEVAALAGDLGLPHHRYEALGMLGFVGTERQADLLVRQFGGDVERNTAHHVHLDGSLGAIEAKVVQEAVGTVRRGPSVLVIDTGVDSLHPDFQSGILAANFAAERFGGLVVGTLAPEVVVDEAGHGTHVGGIVAGSGEAGGDSDSLNGRYQGVYSNGRMVGFQALAESTDGDSAQIDTAAALEGMDWALSDGDRYDVKIIQNSWGTGGDLDPSASVTKATLKLYLEGFNVVFSGGNRGTEDEALNMFCQAPWVMCVANVMDNGGWSDTSSVGTSRGTYRPYSHPDVAAPGTFITATGSTASNDGSDAPGSIGGLFGGGSASQELYETRTGTSMAAPHVSGAMALLLAANPDLSPDQVMDILTETASSSIHSVNEVGTGMINVREAYNLAVQTVGNRDAFEAGRQVKYGGPSTGDPDYSVDPVSLGYTETPTGSAVILPPSQRLPDEVQQVTQLISNQFGITEDLALYLLIGVVALLVLIWLLGIPRRRRRARREARAERRADRRAAKTRRGRKPVAFTETT